MKNPAGESPLAGALAPASARAVAAALAPPLAG